MQHLRYSDHYSVFYLLDFYEPFKITNTLLHSFNIVV